MAMARTTTARTGSKRPASGILPSQAIEALIEGGVVGHIAVFVSTARLDAGTRLKNQILWAAGIGCGLGLLCSVLFVSFYVGPFIRVTETAFARRGKTPLAPLEPARRKAEGRSDRPADGGRHNGPGRGGGTADPGPVRRLGEAASNASTSGGADTAGGGGHAKSSSEAPRISVIGKPWLNVRDRLILSTRAAGIGAPVW